MTTADRDPGEYAVDIVDGVGGPGLVIDGVPVLIRARGDLFVLDEDAFAEPTDLEELARRYLLAKEADRYRRQHGTVQPDEA